MEESGEVKTDKREVKVGTASECKRGGEIREMKVVLDARELDGMVELGALGKSSSILEARASSARRRVDKTRLVKVTLPR